MPMKRLLDRCALLDLKVKGDKRGSLVALESEREAPFPIARVYYIFGTRGDVVRGHHAHLDLDQLAICVAGSCRIMIDDGVERQEVLLDRPDRGLYMGRMIWREMSDFSPGSVLLVLASAAYDEADYIRDYDQFRALVRAGKAP
jgi:dTDP-4-dehydrorhamnose 3,5-epimerase-like enzyme